MYPFFVFYLLVMTTLLCNGQRTEPCNVFPKDQYIEVGSSTEVVCRTTCIRGRVFWTLNNNLMNESLSKTINSSHAVLTLRNFTHHSATLQCHSADTRQILGGTTIKSYSKPSQISCMLHHKHEYSTGVPELLTCEWQHHMISPMKISYTLLYTSRTDWKELCSSNQTHCTVENHKIEVFTNAIFTVRAKTPHWETLSDSYEFDPYSILKTTQPLVKVTALPEQLLVDWSRTCAVSRQCHCEVSYTKVVSDGTPKVLLNKTLAPGEKNRWATIENVESCTNYSISVRCALDKGPWSSWSDEQTVLSKLNKKQIKLRLWRKIAEPEDSQMRRVHAMWTEIPSTCRGTFTYAVTKTPYERDVPGVNSSSISCGSSACDLAVSRDAHRITVQAFQNETLLAEESVYVPATAMRLPRVTDIQASAFEGVILVSWRALVQPVSGYMVDWTHNEKQYYWKRSKDTNITLSGLLDKKRYNITVTPLFEDTTGHATQALHVCSRVGDPGNVTVMDVIPDDRSAFVSWNTKSQEECSGVVSSYTVSYGPQKGPMLNVTVDGTRQDVVLKDLNPDTQYSVYIQATALTGTTKSSERLFQTRRFDPRLLLALSVCGSIFIILVLSLGLFCAIQWKKFREKPVPNPGLSSVALWSSPSHPKETGSSQPFNIPSESLFDQIFTEKAEKTPISPPATSCKSFPFDGQTEEYTDPATLLAQKEQHEESVEPLSSPGESTTLLCTDDSKFSPYRSQSSVESPSPTASKLRKHVPVQQLEKTAPVTVYVTLDMFEQDQIR